MPIHFHQTRGLTWGSTTLNIDSMGPFHPGEPQRERLSFSPLQPPAASELLLTWALRKVLQGKEQRNI